MMTPEQIAAMRADVLTMIIDKHIENDACV